MFIVNGKIYGQDGAFHDGCLSIEGEQITEVFDAGKQGSRPQGKTNRPENAGQEATVDAVGGYIIPGLVDIHFHGCMGSDFCDGTSEAFSKIAVHELSRGVAAICPATMTYPEDKLMEIMRTAARYTRAPENPGEKKAEADLVGINMEGPFLSPDKCGAQNPDFIHRPDAEMFQRLQEASGGLIRLLDIAPETKGALPCILELADKVRISLAHTTADYDTAKAALDAGACHVTHLYNAMPPLLHRAPGVIGAAADDPSCMAELICDGVHVHPSAIRATFRLFGKERLILISDSMRACGLSDGEYDLGGQNVRVNGNRATLTKDGSLAGSVTDLAGCLRYAVQEAHIPLETAIACATINPAKAIGIDARFGQIAPGRRADLVILNKDLTIRQVIYKGKPL